MFQWLKRDLESEAVTAWIQMGPDFDDEPAARAYGSQIVDVSPGDELILVHAIARGRIGLVIEPFGMASTAATTTTAAPAAEPVKRPRKLKSVNEMIDAAHAPEVQTIAAETTTISGDAPADEPDGETYDRAPMPEPQDDGAEALADLVVNNPVPDPADAVAEVVDDPPVAAAETVAPFVTRDGVKVRAFDGATRFWQNFAAEAGAVKSAAKFQELIDAGTPPGGFAAVTIAMRKGDAPD